jgi:hypothetical protein
VKRSFRIWPVALLVLAVWPGLSEAAAFEGRVEAVLTQNGASEALVFTIATNLVRVESMDTNRLHAWNVLDRETGALTLFSPQMGSYMQLRDASAGPAPGPGLPPGAMPGGMPGAPGAPAMPMPMIPRQALQLLATADTTNLLGFNCTRYRIKDGPETMDIWATADLLPFQPLKEVPPGHNDSYQLERAWGDSLKAKKLFPLLAVLKLGDTQELLRFQVTTVQPGAVVDTDGKLFQPPSGYISSPAPQF